MFRSIANAAEPGIDKAMKLYGRSIANAAKRMLIEHGVLNHA